VLANLRAHPNWRRSIPTSCHLLSSWFNRGFLQLRPIDWTTPAHILEKIIRIRGGTRDHELGRPAGPPRAA
jgi:malonyl-CoA decarboxylase